MTEAEIWSLEPQAIEELVRREPDFAVAAVDYHTVYSNMYLARQALNARMDVEAKIAAFLYLYAAGREGGEEIPLSQGETASALGVSRVQVSRAYRRLRGLGAIAPYRNGVRILDMELLKSRCAGGLAD
jgi:CRP-like cAMP-binding protein